MSGPAAVRGYRSLTGYWSAGWLLAAALLAPGSAVSAGCDNRKSAEGERAQGPSLTAVQWFADEPTPAIAPPCASIDETPDQTLDAPRILPVRLFLDARVKAEELRSETRAAQSYFARYGLNFHALSATSIDLRTAIASGQATARSAVAPVRAFLQTHAVPPRPHVNIVMVPRIVPPDSSLARFLRDVAGLTLTASAPPRTTEASAALSEALDIPDYTTTIFLSHRDLARLPTGRRSTTLAHELGHALGLTHGDARADLMNPERRNDCLPRLSADQLATVERRITGLRQ